MKLTTKQTRAVNAYAGFIDAGMTYGEAMRKAASELGETPCLTFLEALAKVHADKYGCNYTMNANNAVFHDGKESTRDTRNANAQRSWHRNVMVWFTPTKQPKPKTTHNRVSEEFKALGMDFLSNFEGKTLDEQIKAAITLLNALK